MDCVNLLNSQFFYGNINELTNKNNTYRTVLATTPTMQLVVMALLPGEEIGEEIHPYISQFIRIESGTGIAIINGLKLNLQDDMAIIIPPGAKHNIINTSHNSSMKLYTIYTPPNHPLDRVDLIKTE